MLVASSTCTAVSVFIDSMLIASSSCTGVSGVLSLCSGWYRLGFGLWGTTYFSVVCESSLEVSDDELELHSVLGRFFASWLG